jgi:hypothetical protein
MVWDADSIFGPARVFDEPPGRAERYGCSGADYLAVDLAVREEGVPIAQALAAVAAVKGKRLRGSESRHIKLFKWIVECYRYPDPAPWAKDEPKGF